MDHLSWRNASRIMIHVSPCVQSRDRNLILTATIMAHMHGNRLTEAAYQLTGEQAEPGYRSTYEWANDFGSTWTCIQIHVFEPGRDSPGCRRNQALTFSNSIMRSNTTPPGQSELLRNISNLVSHADAWLSSLITRTGVLSLTDIWTRSGLTVKTACRSDYHQSTYRDYLSLPIQIVHIWQHV